MKIRKLMAAEDLYITPVYCTVLYLEARTEGLAPITC